MLKSHFSRSDGAFAWLRKLIGAGIGVPAPTSGEPPLGGAIKPGARRSSCAEDSQRVEARPAPRTQGPLINLERRAKFSRMNGAAR